jgi:hypothetical protein
MGLLAFTGMWTTVSTRTMGITDLCQGAVRSRSTTSRVTRHAMAMETSDQLATMQAANTLCLASAAVAGDMPAVDARGKL